MNLTVNFIERKAPDTQSIESVFRQIAKGIERRGIRVVFSKLPYGNSFFGLVGNLLRFRPVEADIYHITGHVHYIALILPKARTVLTIHDLSILRQRTGLRRWLIKKLYFDLPVRRAGLVTAISEATKDDLTKISGIDPSRIQVIENPLRDGLIGLQKPDFNTAMPRLLQVGTAKHKNLDNLVKAIRGLNCRLVVVGSLDSSQLELLGKSRIDYENFFDLDDEDMREQYLNADIVIFCSKFEGFGLPIIEAQATKTPVITSDLSPMREVAGHGAILVDPEDPSAIRDAVQHVVGDATLRANLVQRGLENVKRFDASEIAGKYVAVYEKLIDRRN